MAIFKAPTPIPAAPEPVNEIPVTNFVNQEPKEFNLELHNKEVLNDLLRTISNQPLKPEVEETEPEISKEKMAQLAVLLKLMGFTND